MPESVATTLPELLKNFHDTNVEMFGIENPDQFKKVIVSQPSYRREGGGFMLVSLLSDVQEMIENGEKEKARQAINRIKYLIMEADDTQQIKFA